MASPTIWLDVPAVAAAALPPVEALAVNWPEQLFRRVLFFVLPIPLDPADEDFGDDELREDPGDDPGDEPPVSAWLYSDVASVTVMSTVQPQ